MDRFREPAMSGEENVKPSDSVMGFREPGMIRAELAPPPTPHPEAPAAWFNPWWALLLGLLALLALALLAYDRLVVADGVGVPRVLVVFRVTDEETGKPLPGAEINVTVGSDTGSENGREFTLTTDSNGEASAYMSTMSAVSRSGLRLTTRVTYGLLEVFYSASAPGREPTERQWVGRKIADGKPPTMIVPISLRKKR
jgi:hypothetical protein